MELTFPLDFFWEKKTFTFLLSFTGITYYSTICFNYRTRPLIFFLIKSEA